MFIPKPGKASYENAKAYRPISLTSFLLKTMERIVDDMVKGQIPDELLNFKQHAYVKGRSVETALHEVVHNIEKSFVDKAYTLAIFVDIEGAFNNVQTDTLIQSLAEFKVDRVLIDWIDHMLRNRWINCGAKNINIRDRVFQGTPQGGILSPLLWVTTINSLLRALTDEGFRPVCYADDVAILIRGKHPNLLCRRASEALEVSYKWAKPRGLNVNPDKTEICLFTRKTKIPTFVGPRFQDKTMEISDRVKYLGVILDRKLNWKDHIQSRAEKAHRCWSICRRTIGSKWGLKPRMTHWLYTSVVRPILTYAAVVWWPSMEKKCNIKTLQKVQRICCLGVSGAISTTSTRAMEVVLNLTPIEIHIKYTAAIAAKRIQTIGAWSQGDQKSHHQTILDIPGFDLAGWESDRIPNHKSTTKCCTEIPDRGSWADGSLIGRKSGVHCYTDGSKIDGKTGAGFYIENFGIEQYFRLPDHNTVFQAEVMAITECVKWLNLNNRQKGVKIFTDSQAAIKALSSTTVRTRTLLECRKQIDSLSDQGDVEVIWSPGHCEIMGNVRADELARKGAGLQTINLQNAMPFQAIGAELKDWAKSMHIRLWQQSEVGKVTKILWGNPDGNKTRMLMGLGKPELSRIMGILTGHSTLRAHLFRIGRADSDRCEACEEDVETTEHFLCHCPAFARTRLQHLSSGTFLNMEQLRGVDWRKLRGFVNSTEHLG